MGVLCAVDQTTPCPMPPCPTVTQPTLAAGVANADTQHCTPAPTTEPTASPTATPTAEPTAEPTATPTAEPTATPTATPTAEPTDQPTDQPTQAPTDAPTLQHGMRAVIAQPTQNCQAACSGLGMLCDASAGSHLRSDSQVRAAASNAGMPCTSMTPHGGGWHNWDGPWMIGRRCGWTSGAYTMTCDKGGSGSHRRICMCKKTPTSVIAQPTQNYQAACSGLGMLCDASAGSHLRSDSKVRAA